MCSLVVVKSCFDSTLLCCSSDITIITIILLSLLLFYHHHWNYYWFLLLLFIWGVVAAINLCSQSTILPQCLISFNCMRTPRNADPKR